MPPQRIAVIGGVAAGPAAAAEAARVDPGAHVTLFEQGPHISYGACEIPYYVAGEIEPLETLVALTPEQFERTRGATVRVGHQVLEMQQKRSRLVVKRLADGHVFTHGADKIILATGAQPHRPDIAGIDAPNVWPVRTLVDAKAVRAEVASGTIQHVVILGGGFVGLEMAEALVTAGCRVTILQPGGRVLGGLLHATVRTSLDAALQHAGVAVRDEQATHLDVNKAGRVHRVRTDRGEQIGCQLVLVAMGITPNTTLARQAGIRHGAQGGLMVNEHMRTSAPNVWACGDCIEVPRLIDGASILWPLAPTAFRTARVAAQNAARRGRGAAAVFDGICANAAVKAFGLEVATVGLSHDEALQAGLDAMTVTVQHTSRVSFFPGAQPLHVHLVVERARRRLLGGQLVGAEGAALRANVLVPLLRQRATVDDLAALDLMYTPPLAPLHDPLLIAARQAQRKLR